MKNLTLTFALLLSSFSFAQRNPSSNMFWNTYTHFNPAMSGFEEKTHGNLTYRNQYPSLSQSYHTTFFNANTRLGDHHGVGITYAHENVFIWKRDQINLNYNYQMKLGEDHRLAVGLAGTYFNSRFDFEGITFAEGQEPNFDYDDINFNVGIAYSWKDLLINASTTNIFTSVLNPNPTYNYFYENDRVYSVGATYNFHLGKRFTLKPHLLGQYVNGFTRLAFNAQFALDNKYWIGTSVMNRDHFSFMAGWNFYEKFRVAYSYDVTMSKLNQGVSGGAHEISLGFYLK